MCSIVLLCSLAKYDPDDKVNAEEPGVLPSLLSRKIETELGAYYDTSIKYSQYL